METTNNMNAETTQAKEVKEYKVGSVEKFFGATGLAMHRSMIQARDYAAACPITGTFAYAVAAPWAVTIAPFRGLFNRKEYEEYAKAEHANPEKVMDFDFTMNKVVEVPEKQKTPALAPSASSMVWAGVAATAICIGGLLGIMSRSDED